ncbi:MAG TPA: hypothetical protein VGM31_14325 [Puia sp.]|jgi:hypothetical protein
MAKVTNRKITDLHFDNANINKGTEFGSALLEKSIQEVGLVRSVVVDKNDILIAGNKTAAKAGELGVEKVVMIETDGTELIVVKRKDLDINTPQGAKAKILDNTVSRHNYVEDAQIMTAVCETAEIYNIHAYGLGEQQRREHDPDNPQPVSFSASNKPVIKIQLASADDLDAAIKDINYLMNQKYEGAIVTAKGGKS